LLAEVERVRGETLSRPRDADTLRADVVQMRQRMRAELDRTDAARFDLKQGEGGLSTSNSCCSGASWRERPRRRSGSVRAIRRAVALACEDDVRRCTGVRCVTRAHAALLEAGLRCTLDRRRASRRKPDAIAEARAAIRAATHAAGSAFD
jgi:glutamate-ammonia-ligase adenylyltransferase